MGTWTYDRNDHNHVPFLLYHMSALVMWVLLHKCWLAFPFYYHSESSETLSNYDMFEDWCSSLVLHGNI